MQKQKIWWRPDRVSSHVGKETVAIVGVMGTPAASGSSCLGIDAIDVVLEKCWIHMRGGGVGSLIRRVVEPSAERIVQHRVAEAFEVIPAASASARGPQRCDPEARH